MVSQIDLVGAISNELDRQGIKHVNQRQFNAIIKAANLVLAEIAIPNTLSKPGMGLEEWLLSDDTGASSKYMACILLGKGPHADHAYPYDSDDFGRCYRFLRAVPEARKNLDKLKECGPVWNIYIESWAELERLYELGLKDGARHKQLTELLTRLREKLAYESKLRTEKK